MFKAIIKYVAGVPQILLDFVKTINDEQGYCPTYECQGAWVVMWAYSCRRPRQE